MAALEYESGPSGDFTARIGGGGGFPLGAGAGMGGLGWLEELARRSARNKLRRQELELKMLRDQAYAPKKFAPTALDRLRERAEASELNTKMAQNQALTQGPPMEWTAVGGGFAGPTPDEDRMSAIQRSLFLPDAAGYQGPSLEEISAVGRRESDEFMRRPDEDVMHWRWRTQMAGLWDDEGVDETGSGRTTRRRRRGEEEEEGG